MNYNLNLTERNYESYPIVIIPTNIIDNFTKEIHYTEILIFLGERYYPAKSKVYQGSRIDFFGDNSSKSFTLGEYLNLENGDYNFMFGDFYYSNPYKSEYKLPVRPKKYKYVDVDRNNNFFIFLNILVNFIIFSIIRNFYSINESLFVLLSFFVITGVLILLGLFKQKVSEKIDLEDHEYKKNVDDFLEKVDIVTKKVIHDFINYKSKKLQIVETNREVVEKEIYLQLLKPFYESKPISVISSKGRTELFFLEKLYKYFDHQISVDKVPNIGNNPFQPDFLLICDNTGFHLSIEIDEPYSVENGKPIHHNRTNDKKRDDFFEEINWGVIRFSEKQIIQHSEECCKLIKKILDCIVNKQTVLIHNIDPDKKWNYEEALIMSNTNYRNSYLPEKMKIQIRYIKKDKYFDEFDLPF